MDVKRITASEYRKLKDSMCERLYLDYIHEYGYIDFTKFEMKIISEKLLNESEVEK